MQQRDEVVRRGQQLPLKRHSGDTRPSNSPMVDVNHAHGNVYN
jgi:hypothetical protein